MSLLPEAVALVQPIFHPQDLTCMPMGTLTGQSDIDLEYLSLQAGDSAFGVYKSR